MLAARHGNLIADAMQLDADALLDVLDCTDAWRRPQRFSELVAAVLAAEPEAGPLQALLERVVQAGTAVDAGAIAREAATAAEIKQRLHAARREAIARMLGHSKGAK
jgi:tRNA nucleotidyltransferase (CCA-adding enzyme)